MTDKMRLAAFHRPSLTAGDYTIEVTQSVSAADESQRFPSVKRRFSVECERLTLAPTEIHSVFPPPNSNGDHALALPQVVLRRSTLPWERTACTSGANDASPWLALLVLDEGDEVTLRTTTLAEFGTKGEGSADAVQVVEAERTLFERLLPRKAELDLLTHVREVDVFVITEEVLQTVRRAVTKRDVAARVLAALRGLKDVEFFGEQAFSDALEVIEEPALKDTINSIKLCAKQSTDVAVVVGNRVPKQGGSSTVHLVSVEGCYDRDGKFVPTRGVAKVALVSLWRWRFACLEGRLAFGSLLDRLDSGPLRLQPPPGAMPDAVERYREGFLPLRHRLRDGGRTVSWYRGPFLPGEPKPPRAQKASAVAFADALLMYDTASELFDVSYAAAWQLGRLLALQSRKFAFDLYRWKRARAHREFQRADVDACQLPLSATRIATNEPERAPHELVEWLRSLSLLKGVPPVYVVPDERSLPQGSLRFFELDPSWVEHLLDGAFSIGRVTEADRENERAQRAGDFRDPQRRISGILLRSEVVTGWPGLRVDGFAAPAVGSPATPLQVLRFERVAPDVIVCLFAGALASVLIHLKAEAVHLGIRLSDSPAPAAPAYVAGKGGTPVMFRDAGTTVIDVLKLCSGSSLGASSELAAYLTVAVEARSFTLVAR